MFLSPPIYPLHWMWKIGFDDVLLNFHFYNFCKVVQSYKSEMEIDRRLKIKYNNAIYVIQRALTLYSYALPFPMILHITILSFQLSPSRFNTEYFIDSVEEVALSFNGGKDSTVLLHHLRAGRNLSFGDHGDAETTLPIRTIYFESPTVFPEINSFTYETASI
ncbi:hypothetical protein SASPL_108598 [Salvia splendens]|uniref:FAD synthetase n=1 Tax=Salvia splendens TaxID=180675 RepID=A0A8X9A6S9_SALSN|nr:hypothetical protein SASPL_108598 [Salvia splendens]